MRAPCFHLPNSFEQLGCCAFEELFLQGAMAWGLTLTKEQEQVRVPVLAKFVVVA